MAQNRAQRRLAQLATQAERLRSQMKSLKHEEKEARKRQEAKRVKLVGTAILALVRRGEWPWERLLELLDKEIARPRERELLGLPVDAGLAEGPESAGFGTPDESCDRE